MASAGPAVSISYSRVKCLFWRGLIVCHRDFSQWVIITSNYSVHTYTFITCTTENGFTKGSKEKLFKKITAWALFPITLYPIICVYNVWLWMYLLLGNKGERVYTNNDGDSVLRPCALDPLKSQLSSPRVLHPMIKDNNPHIKWG